MITFAIPDKNGLFSNYVTYYGDNVDTDVAESGGYVSIDPTDVYKLPFYMSESGKIVPVGACPLHHTWSEVLLSWVVDMGAARQYFVKVAKAARSAKEFAPFVYNDMTFDGDLDAQRRLSVLVSAAKSAIAAGYSFTKDFTLADNTVVQLTAEDFIGIEMAKLWQVDVAFQEYRLKKAAIEAAATLEELEAITI